MISSVQTCEASGVPVDQVKQRKQVDPNNIDKMPVQATHLQRRVVLRSKTPFPGCVQKPGKEADPDDHVKRVQSGHDEVKGKINLGVARVGQLIGMTGERLFIEIEGSAWDVMLHKLVVVFDSFDAEECEAQGQGEHKARDQERAAGSLRSPDGQDYGQAAADQDGGVCSTEAGIEGFAGSGKVAEIPQPVNEVGAEQAAEEHDLGAQKYPHVEAGRGPRIVGRGLAVAHRPQEVEHGKQITNAEYRGASGREYVQHLELLRVLEVAARHAEVAEDELGEEGEIEAQENDQGCQTRQAFGIHPAGNFRPPEVQTAQITHERAPDHDVVKVCDHKIGIGDVNIDPQCGEE